MSQQPKPKTDVERLNNVHEMFGEFDHLTIQQTLTLTTMVSNVKQQTLLQIEQKMQAHSNTVDCVSYIKEHIFKQVENIRTD